MTTITTTDHMCQILADNQRDSQVKGKSNTKEKNPDYEWNGKSVTKIENPKQEAKKAHKCRCVIQ